MHTVIQNFFFFFLQFQNAFYGDAKGWARSFFSCLRPYIPGVMNPHTKIVQQWNQFFVISCLVAIFVDPLFFFLLSVQEVVSIFSPRSMNKLRLSVNFRLKFWFEFQALLYPSIDIYYNNIAFLRRRKWVETILLVECLWSFIIFSHFWMQDNKCIVIDRPLTTTFVVFRSITDLIYFMHILLQVKTSFPCIYSELVLGCYALSANNYVVWYMPQSSSFSYSSFPFFFFPVLQDSFYHCPYILSQRSHLLFMSI